MRQLSQSLAANLAVLDKMFGTSADYYAKEITIYHCRGSILLFDGWPHPVKAPTKNSGLPCRQTAGCFPCNDKS